jgi:hypothetical protein
MVHRIAMTLALAAAVALGACKQTGEGEFQVETPDVDVSTDTSTVRTPTVEMDKETTTVVTPDVDVKTPAERGDTSRSP